MTRWIEKFEQLYGLDPEQKLDYWYGELAQDRKKSLPLAVLSGLMSFWAGFLTKVTVLSKAAPLRRGEFMTNII